MPQNLYEFWVVAPRPVALNGLGSSAAQAEAELARREGRDYEPAAVLLARIRAERMIREEEETTRRRPTSCPAFAWTPSSIRASLSAPTRR